MPDDEHDTELLFLEQGLHIGRGRSDTSETWGTVRTLTSKSRSLPSSPRGQFPLRISMNIRDLAGSPLTVKLTATVALG